MTARRGCFIWTERLLAVWLAVFATVGSAFAFPDGVPLKTASNSDFSDIWWNPSEAGWGLQMVNTGTFIFVTIYVYGPSGEPTWYAGGMNQTGTTYTGNLFVGTGPYFGGPFNPAAAGVRQVGTITFAPTDPNTGQLTYSVDGVIVTKAIQRQPLTFDNYTGTYITYYTFTATNCLDPTSNGSYTVPLAVQITQSGSGQSVTLATQDAAGATCTTNGTYSQLGRNGRIDGPYACTTGEQGSVVVFEMNNHVHQFNARTTFQSTNLGCISNGRITGLIPN